MKKRFDPRMGMEEHSYGEDSRSWGEDSGESDNSSSSSEADSEELSGPGKYKVWKELGYTLGGLCIYNNTHLNY